MVAVNLKYSTVLCFLLLAHFAGGTAFSLKDAAGQNGLVLAGSSSSRHPAAVAETKKQESVPAFDLDDPQAKGIILAFHRWPDKEEETVILEKTAEAGLTKKAELSVFKAWIFEWVEWQKGVTAREACNGLPELSSLEYCEPDYLLRSSAGSLSASDQSPPVSSSASATAASPPLNPNGTASPE